MLLPPSILSCQYAVALFFEEDCSVQIAWHVIGFYKYLLWLSEMKMFPLRQDLKKKWKWSLQKKNLHCKCGLYIFSAMLATFLPTDK